MADFYAGKDCPERRVMQRWSKAPSKKKVIGKISSDLRMITVGNFGTYWYEYW
jgi:hypothetical protein